MTNAWIEEYLELLKKEDSVNVFLLKNKNFPSHIYKYRALNSNTLDCLEDDWLWASEPKYMNDSFESSLNIDNHQVFRNFISGKVFKEEFKKMYNYDFPNETIQEIIKSDHPHELFVLKCSKLGIHLPSPQQVYEQATYYWEKFMAEQEKYIRICCFGTCYESILMWAHYADSNKGFCLEYNFKDNAEIRTFLQPVYYSDKRNFINSIPEMNIYSKVIASITKSKEWEYEQEWRVVRFSKTQVEQKNNRLDMPVPTAIYVGYNFEQNIDTEKKKLLEIAAAKNIPIHRMANHPTEYKLVTIS